MSETPTVIAVDFMLNHLDALADGLIAGDSWDLVWYDLSDSWTGEITDQWYSAEEAIKVLRAYPDHEETDSGLWDGADWEQALSTRAAMTFSNACHAEAEAIYNNVLRADFEYLVDENLDEDEDPVPVDDDGDPIDPWYYDPKKVKRWAEAALKRM